MDCTQAIEDLKEKQSELFDKSLQNVIDKYDNLMGTYTGLIDVLEAKKEFRTANGNSILEGSATWDAVKQQLNLQNSVTSMIESEIKAYKQQMVAIKKEYGIKSTQYKEAVAGLRELEVSFWESKTAAENFEKELREMKLQLEDWQIEKFERAASKQSAYRDMLEATDYKDGRGGITEYDYDEAIKTNDRIIKALNEKRETVRHDMLQFSVYSDEYREYAEMLADIDEQIMNIAVDNAELKQSIVELRFEPFYDAQDALDDLITDYDILMGMIDQETWLNDDATFSEYGIANLALLNKSMDAEKQKIANFKAQLENIQQMYDNNNITKDQYEEYTNEILDGIRNSSQALYKYNEQMLSMYESQITKENELLTTNIDKRREALDKKKEYYEYDRTLKQKNKDINTLKAQIAALEGTNILVHSFLIAGTPP